VCRSVHQKKSGIGYHKDIKDFRYYRKKYVFKINVVASSAKDVD